MNFSMGIDMLEIARIRSSLENPRFLQRCFSDAERREYEQRGRSALFLAGCFSAKEAFSKALGTGVRGFSLHEISVLRDALGKPFLSFSGNAKTIADTSGLAFEVSITHTKEYLVAVVAGYQATAEQHP